MTPEQKFEAEVRQEEVRADRDPTFCRLNPEEKYKYLAVPDRQTLNRIDFQETIAVWTTKLDEIESTARRGRINGLRLLALLAMECTRRLEKWSEQYPEYVAEVAAEYRYWPVLATPNRTQLDTKAVLTKIRLGTREPSMGTTPNPPLEVSPAHRWAAGLKRIIDMARGSIAGLSVSDFQAYPDLGSGINSYPGFEAAAKALPAFSKSTSEEWWAVAEPLYASMTNNTPWQFEDLRQLLSPENAGAVDGRKPSDIKKLVRQSFLRLPKLG